MNKENLLKKTEVLSRAIAMLAPLYHDKNLDESQRGLLETLIGAGIFYLPQNKFFFSGKISKAALEKIKIEPNLKLVEEHGFPRKVSGHKLFNEYLEVIKNDNTAFCNLYIEKFGKFNLVLKEENQKLKKYQKTSVFISEIEAYKDAEIELVDFTNEDLYLPQLKKFKTIPLEINEIPRNHEIIEDLNVEMAETIDDFLEDIDNDQDFNGGDNIVFHLGNNDKSPAQQYKRFLNFVIDNFNVELENTNILRNFFTQDPEDEVLGAARTYNRVRNYRGWNYSTHVGTPAIKVRINKIAEILEINLTP